MKQSNFKKAISQLDFEQKSLLMIAEFSVYPSNVLHLKVKL